MKSADPAPEALLQALQTEGRAADRLAAIRHLVSHVHSEDVREALRDTAQHDRSSRVRAAAVGILAETPHPSDLPALRQACRDPEIRRRVCQEDATFSLPSRPVLFALLAEARDPHLLPLLSRRLRTYTRAEEGLSDLIRVIVQLAPHSSPEALREAQTRLRQDLVKHDLPVDEALDAIDAALGRGLPIPSETGVVADPRLPLPASSNSPERPSRLYGNEIPSLTFTSRRRPVSNVTGIFLLVLGGLGHILWDAGVPLPFFPVAAWLCVGLAILSGFVPRQERVHLSGRELRVMRRGEGLMLLPRHQRCLLSPGARVQRVSTLQFDDRNRNTHLAVLGVDNQVIRFGHTFPDEQLQQIAAEVNAYLEVLEETEQPG